MTRRSFIDPESRAPLEALLAEYPGGVARIPDLSRRREIDEQLAIEAAALSSTGGSVAREDLVVARADGSPLTVRIYRPDTVAQRPGPGIYFIHGGGMIMGTLATEDLVAAMLCEELGVVVASVDYRLAPEHPHPAPVLDCVTGLTWFDAHAPDLGVDPHRIAVYGGSAGGGLALACALRVRDVGGPDIRYVMSLYPMVDDRCATPSNHEVVDVGVWDRDVNLEAWALYLGTSGADAYAAPARADDLAGLPPTFIDVGEVDLFRDDDIALAARLLQAGVSTELHVYPGAYHASELIAPDATLSRTIWDTRLRALRQALFDEVRSPGSRDT